MQFLLIQSQMHEFNPCVINTKPANDVNELWSLIIRLFRLVNLKNVLDHICNGNLDRTNRFVS